MYWCNKGDLLLVKGKFPIEYVRKILLNVESQVYVGAILNSNKSYIRVPENSIVMALEGSCAPFYESDLIRCLWDEKVVHIKRTELVHYQKNIKNEHKKIAKLNFYET